MPVAGYREIMGAVRRRPFNEPDLAETRGLAEVATEDGEHALAEDCRVFSTLYAASWFARAARARIVEAWRRPGVADRVRARAVAGTPTVPDR